MNIFTDETTANFTPVCAKRLLNYWKHYLQLMVKNYKVQTIYKDFHVELQKKCFE